MYGKNLEKVILQTMEQEESTIKAIVGDFYKDGSITNFSLSSEKAPLAPLLALADQVSDEQVWTQERLRECCLEIRSNVKQGKQDNIEVQLHKGRQLANGQIFPLGHTVVKLLPMDAEMPVYLFVREGDTLDATVLLGSDTGAGILVIKREGDDDFFLRLAEFHLLSLRNDPDPHKEVGLLTSYVWLCAKVYSCVLLASSLNPVKALLLSDWLQDQWREAKDSTQNTTAKTAKERGERDE